VKIDQVRRIAPALPDARVVGVRVSLAKAKRKVVTKLLEQAWARKAPKSLLA
jgi:hypothetical protein